MKLRLLAFGIVLLSLAGFVFVPVGPAPALVHGQISNPPTVSGALSNISSVTFTGGNTITVPASNGSAFISTNGVIAFTANSGNTSWRLGVNTNNGALLAAPSSGVIGWANAGDPVTNPVTESISEISSGVLGIGAAATSGSTTGKLKAAGYMSVGTTFTSNAGCGDTTLTGGATAGKYTSVTAGTCTTIITMGNGSTAPNGWNCTATDLTTAADNGNIHQTATTTTTASLNETTVVANDVIQFSCMGY